MNSKLNATTALAGDVTGTYLSTIVTDTECTGTSDYLDGTGTCDTLDGLDDLSNANTKFIQNDTAIRVPRINITETASSNATLFMAGNITFVSNGSCLIIRNAVSLSNISLGC